MKKLRFVGFGGPVLAIALAAAQPAQPARPQPRAAQAASSAASSASTPAGTFAPGENLVVQGIPPIPQALADEVDRYAQFRAASFYDWHPTKRQILIGTRFGDTNQIHEVRFPGGARTQLTFFRDSAGGGVTYHPRTGESFVFSKDVGGDEFFQTYRYHVGSGAIALLTDGRSRNATGIWANAGDRLAYGSTRRTGKDVDIYVISPADPKAEKMIAQLQGGGWSVNDWSPDDRQLLVTEYISANESYLWLFDATGGAKTLVTPKGGPEKISYEGARFSRNGRGIYVATDRGSEFKRLTYVDLASKEHRYLTDHIKWDVDEFDLSHDGKRIALVTNEDGIGVLRLLDTATGRERPAPKLPAGTVSGVRWHRNSRELGFALRSARTPTDVYSFQIDGGKLVRWTASETGGLNTSAFSEPELVRWKSFDGRTISGFLYRPSNRFSGRRPLVINIHGGPEGQARPGFLASANYYLNELGIAVIYPNVRGSSGYGKTFLALDNGFKREDSVKDIGALFDWIRTRPDIDAARVMVTGGSYGGFMTLAVATTYADRIACAVDIVGVSNFVTFLKNTSGYRQDLRRAEYGDERDPKMREFLERTAPLNNAHKITKPLFVIQGKNDPRVPYTEAEQIVAAARKNGTPVWYLVAKDEGHGFRKKKNTDFQLYATIMFAKKYLVENPNARASR